MLRCRLPHLGRDRIALPELCLGQRPTSSPSPRSRQHRSQDHCSQTIPSRSPERARSWKRRKALQSGRATARVMRAEASAAPCTPVRTSPAADADSRGRHISQIFPEVDALEIAASSRTEGIDPGEAKASTVAPLLEQHFCRGSRGTERLRK